MAGRKVLLVGWDAADWKIIDPLIERGEMRALSGLINRGVMGDLETLQPVLSPMLWNSIGTGKRADEHGVLGFTEVDSLTGSVRPVTSTSRRVKALWNILSQQGLRTNVVGWFGSHPAEPVNGACVSEAFARPLPRIMPGTVFPERLAEPLTDLRVTPDEIGFGLLQPFIPRLTEMDLTRPNRIAPLAKTLAECFTTHAAATYVMEHEPWDFMAVYYIGIDHFSHGFINYHPPRPDWVDAEDFKFYNEVVNSGYRLMDLFLSRLLYLAGPDTTVILVSDHGFHCDHLRPVDIPQIPAGPTTQHRQLGVVAMAGEGIRRDERIYGANLLDIAPTVLALFGLPAGDDMPGRVLAEAFETPPDPVRIPSWDNIPGDAGMHPPGYSMPPSDAEILMRQFIDLGYIDEPTEDRARAAADCERERMWNLARVYMSTFRLDEALPLLEQIYAQAPERGDYGILLAEAQRRIGLRDEATATLESALERHRETPVARLTLGRIAFEDGRSAEALQHLLEAEKAGDANLPEICIAIGYVYLRRRKWFDAERIFRKALTLDPNSATARTGMAQVLLRLGQPEAAATEALAAVGFQHALPRAHFVLGTALLRLGRRDRARQAFETCLTLQPPLQAAHRVLAAIHPDAERAEFHRRASREFADRRRAEMAKLDSIRQLARHRAIDRAISRADAGRLHQTDEGPVTSAAEASREETGPALDFVVVSGLPRSGTSLMMQMLVSAGVPVMTDSQRPADPDNPEGYYEWERIRQVLRHPEILREAEGKAIKVVAPLLSQLPAKHKYRVIYMDRPVEEIAASQRKMIRNRANAPAAEPEKVVRLLAGFRAGTLSMLASSSRFECLVVDYPDLVRTPQPWLEKISQFLDQKPEPGAMAAAIRPDLHRNRNTAAMSASR